jgi:hypothetical protein
VQLPTATESLGGKSAESASVLPEAAAATKPKKQQPKGLRMRYRPSGYGPEGPGTIGDSDSEEPSWARSQFRAPPELSGHSKHSKKRKEREEETVNDASEKTHKTKKKKQKEGRMEEDTVMEDIIRQEPESHANGVSKKSKDREHKVLPMVNGAHHEEVDVKTKPRKKDKEKKKKKRDKENS